MDPEMLERLKAERRQRYQDDPYYIDSGRNSGRSSPLHNILKNNNGDELDIDAIPIMDLALDGREPAHDQEAAQKPRKKPRKRMEIAADETIGGDEPSFLSPSPARPITNRAKKSLLEVDSSALSSLSLSEERGTRDATPLEIERRQVEEEEMQKAMKEVERMRLEMQRAQERVRDPEDAVVVKRKKKKTTARTIGTGEEVQEGKADGDEATTKKVKKKKKKKVDDTDPGDGSGGLADPEAGAEEGRAPTKKKKRRQVTFDEADARD